MAAPPAALVEAMKTARDQDTCAALEQLEAAGEPLTVAGLYSQSVFVLYGEKDVPRMIAFAGAGIRHCLLHANAKETTAEDATTLRGIAKTISYNLGSNCWPGWRDEGITINATDIAIGLDAARLNLRLARELDRPDDKVAAAQWLLGAQLLASQQGHEASAMFVAAAKLNDKIEKPTDEAMCLGYAALADMQDEPQRATATGMFEAAVRTLRDEASDDAKFYADQLETARQVFAE